MKVRLKTEKDIETLRVSGRILAETLAALEAAAKPGVALRELDALARKTIAARGGVPTFLGYTPEGAGEPYPAAICASPNNTVVHGIPGKRVLQAGDILAIDCGVTYKGYVTDAAITVAVGNVSGGAVALVKNTKRSLDAAIAACVPGNTLGDVGYAIERVAKSAGLSIMHGLTGHGVGFELHEDPCVYNYGKPGDGMKLVPGLVIAIEPMFSNGSAYAVANRDGSFETKDGSLSAHFEHTVAITENGCEVLTAPQKTA